MAAPLREFLRGDSKAFLTKAVLALLEKPKARRDSAETQQYLDSLVHFFTFEAVRLRKAIVAAGIPGHFVSQEERDRAFLTSRHAREKGRLGG